MEPGHRTVLSIFEHKAAHSPNSIWALQPKSNEDLTAGFESITYGVCMKAVSHAAQWLQEKLPSAGKPFEAFAYQGPSDLRVLLLCLAAAKLEKKILLPSRRSSSSAQLYLVRQVGCVALVHAKGTDPMFGSAEAGIEAIVAPELADWLHASGPLLQMPSSKPWAEAQNDPWIILHTSGTTGLPKIVCYTHKMMAKADAIPPKDEGPTTAELYSSGRWFTSIPFFHFVGLCNAFQFAAILGSVCIAPPIASSPVLSGQQLIDLIDQTSPSGLILSPNDIEKLTSSEAGWTALKKVKYIAFIGAQLRQSLGDRLTQHGVKVLYGLGTTEAGGYPQLLRDDNEWDWFTFPDAAGTTFELYPSHDDVYELVFYKQPELAPFQQVFLAFPELEVFRTKDLYYRHPRLRNTWKIAGRTDDYLKLGSGFGMLATPVEERVLEGEGVGRLVEAVLVAGYGRDYPCLLVSPRMGVEAGDVIRGVWRVVEEVNKRSGEEGRIRRELILVTDPTKPFPRNSKGSVSRRDTVLEYEKEIDSLYRRQRYGTST